jgi:phytoene dehydrogenase-like protein
MKSYDAVVIGAGINGLTCGAYLARAGLSVLVVEARDQIGGMAALALTVGRLSPVVARELGLRRHGLRLVQPDVRVFAPQPDGRAVTLWTDVNRTARELADNTLVGAHDSSRYAAADEQLRELARALAPLLRRAPADLSAPSLGRSAVSLARLARLDRRLLRALPMAVRDLTAEWFESDALQAAVAARGVLYTGLGPRAPGTAAVLLTDAASGHGGIAGHSVAARVRHREEHAVGLVLASGDEIDAPLIVSTLDPRTTLLDLLEPELLGPRLSWRAANIRQTGVTASVTFELAAVPRFSAAAGDERLIRGRILIAPSMRYLDLASRAARYGESAEDPLIEATIPSLLDGGTPRLHAVVQAVAPDADTATTGDNVARTIARYAPGFEELVVDRRVLTPSGLEREFGARGGHPMHAEVALDQWFEWRPVHGLGRYRMPLEGYFLAGAGAHPGGGVTGMPGRTAATEILAGVGQGRLRLSP